MTRGLASAVCVAILSRLSDSSSPWIFNLLRPNGAAANLTKALSRGLLPLQQSPRAYSCLSAEFLETAFGRAIRTRQSRRTVTCNWKPIASKTLKTVLKFGCFKSPSKAR